MYHSRKNPLKKVTEDSEVVETARSGKMRKAHKAFLRWHHPENWPILRETLIKMGRGDLIGNGERHLVPAWHPSEEGAAPAVRETGARTARQQAARTPAPRTPAAPAGKRGNGMPAPHVVNAQATAKRQPERAGAGGRAAAAAPEKTRPSILSTIKTKPKAPRK